MIQELGYQWIACWSYINFGSRSLVTYGEIPFRDYLRWFRPQGPRMLKSDNFFRIYLSIFF